MTSDKKFIHPISKNDLAFYKKLCPSNSYYFSNSEAYLKSYFNFRKALCYNDKETIFFFGRFSDDALFICCPKGGEIETKISHFFSFAKSDYGIRKIWLFEIPCVFSEKFFRNLNIKNWEIVEMRRPLLSLDKFKNLPALLGARRKLRTKWNQFHNFLKRTEGRTEINLTTPNRKNLNEIKQLITRWRQKIRQKDSFLSTEMIVKKNLRIINDLFLNPNLYEAALFYCNNTLRGVRIAFKIERSFNLAASVLCVDMLIPQSAVVLNLLFFQLMASKGYKLINLGNSYTPSIEVFKKQFPSEQYDIAYEYHITF